MSSPPQFVPDSQLGLTAAEVQLLRYHQHAAMANAGARSSRAASAASSQGRLLLDPSSLAALSAHFDRLILIIQQRWTDVRFPSLRCERRGRRAHAPPALPADAARDPGAVR